jgi:hypothetical protein
MNVEIRMDLSRALSVRRGPAGAESPSHNSRGIIGADAESERRPAVARFNGGGS